jgi:hypothetical protein
MSVLHLRHIRNLLKSSSATSGRLCTAVRCGRCLSEFAADSQARSFSDNSPVSKPGKGTVFVKPGTPRKIYRSSSQSKPVWIKAGLPFVLFSVLASWVVANAYEGKLHEMEASQGKSSKSIRQHQMELEQNEILERIGFIAKQDFDNTKRIQRPHEVLEERRKERERRNVWYRRAWRWVKGEGV